MKSAMNKDEYTMANMMKYLQDFDVLYRKYFWDRNEKDNKVSETLWEQASLLENRYSVLNDQWDIDAAQNAYLTVDKIYGKGMTDYLSVIQLVRDKFINGFVGIAGIDKLFRESYFYFEWMMHLEYKKEKHDYSRYRDHYIHQIKNMYELLNLLDDWKFMDKSIRIYQKNTSVVAEMMRKSVRKQADMLDEEEKKLFCNIVSDTSPGIEDAELEELANARIEQYCYRYILHAAAIIAALVHDIGYPIDYMIRTTKTLHEFLPLSEAFLHINDAMPHLEEILQESLLYRTVKPEKIAERVRDKQNHGAISAVILLSQYYDAGLIYSLRPIERMAIELAAVVIYDHTLHYGCMTGKKEDLYRNFFDDNPLSYLFRLCDDLQEWERVYFDISSKSNIMLCPRCYLPITKELEKETGEEEEVEKGEEKEKEKGTKYSCQCGVCIDKKTRFLNRKLIHISACEAVELQAVKEDKGGDKEETDTVQPFDISMRYDLTALLQLSYYAPEFAMQRADDLYKIRRMLSRQSELPKIYVDAFLTNNPITIKTECLKQYLDAKEKTDWWPVWWGEQSDKLQKAIENYRRSVRTKSRVWAGVRQTLKIDDMVNTLFENRKNRGPLGRVKRKWQENLYFYACLLAIGDMVEGDESKDDSKEQSLGRSIAAAFKIQDRPTKVLIMDYIRGKRQYVSSERFRNFQSADQEEMYDNMGKSTQSIADMVDEYVNSDAYQLVKEILGDPNRRMGDLEGIYDFYTDYELFAQMAAYAKREMRKREKSNELAG